jgi:CTP-dependent riboflavin kinase
MKGEKLSGRLATGIGMGVTFTRLDWANVQFIDRVGINPFPGTVNVILDDPESFPVWVRLKMTEGIRMDNPNTGPHDCDAKCWKVSINDRVDGAIVFPLVDNYPPAQVEVIAAIGVRAEFNLEDGDTINLTMIEET